jgi:hypothetical protein
MRITSIKASFRFRAPTRWNSNGHQFWKREVAVDRFSRSIRQYSQSPGGDAASLRGLDVLEKKERK